MSSVQRSGAVGEDLSKGAALVLYTYIDPSCIGVGGVWRLERQAASMLAALASIPKASSPQAHYYCCLPPHLWSAQSELADSSLVDVDHLFSAAIAHLTFPLRRVHLPVRHSGICV